MAAEAQTVDGMSLTLAIILARLIAAAQGSGLFDLVVLAMRFHYPMWWFLKQKESSSIRFNFSEKLNARSLDLWPIYHDAGQSCWINTSALGQDRVLIGPNPASIILPAMWVYDIDD